MFIITGERPAFNGYIGNDSKASCRERQSGGNKVHVAVLATPRNWGERRCLGYLLLSFLILFPLPTPEGLARSLVYSSRMFSSVRMSMFCLLVLLLSGPARRHVVISCLFNHLTCFAWKLVNIVDYIVYYISYDGSE